MTAPIRPAALALAALLLITGCGGSASPGHTARSACLQQADHIQTLATSYYYDSGSGLQTKALAELEAVNAGWSRMHKEHCPASSYTQLNRVLSGLGMTLPKP